ncbi:MAG: glycoside hydrolase family 3 C-terminal domain-containing protein [Bifidobacteriaceae bacterium]|jgi:beta-glucosidase|nr:glycoside hydrolase family 3 C-terminal domain-containing protein [Bifidobacteriaceae bacterium]
MLIPKKMGAIVASIAMAVTGLAAFTAISASGAKSAQAAVLPYQNQSLPFSVRAADLVSRMTLEEKIDQLRAMQPHSTWAAKPAAITRLGVKSYGYWSEGNHGIYFPTLSDEGYTMYPQSTAIASTWNTQLVRKIASGISDEERDQYNVTCPPGDADASPTGGACWGLSYFSPNENLLRDPRWGRADEAYSEDPELAGETAGNFVAGMQGGTASKPDSVSATQGSSAYLKAIATPKHFIANNSEQNRDTGTSNVTEADFHNYFLQPFSMSAGTFGAKSVMSSYNAISEVENYTTNYPSISSWPTKWSPFDSQGWTTPSGIPIAGGTPGTPSAGSRYNLETELRRTIGFTGYVVSDCSAITRVWATGGQGHSWEPPQVGTQITQAMGDAWAIKAGTDLDCSGGDYPSSNGLIAAQNQGYVTEADIDNALVQVFTARFQTGEFDSTSDVPWDTSDYSAAGSQNADDTVGFASNAHKATAHEAALEGPVLLKNDGTLPLKSKAGMTVALGGSDILDTFQAGSYSGPAQTESTFATGLAKELDTSVTTTSGSTTPSIGTHLALFPDVINSDGTAITVSKCATDPCTAADANTAEYQIANADNIVVTVGHKTNDGGEGSDRTDVALPRMQADLIASGIEPLAEKYGKKIVVWMQGKTMFDISAFKTLPNIGAIVWSSFDGMYQGDAMAELLFGDTVTLEDGTTTVANFSGKLPITWYSDVNTQLGAATSPTYAVMDYRMTKAEGAPCGRTYEYYQVDTTNCLAPDYVFGYGMSYSKFSYGVPSLSADTITPNDPVTVSVPVTNTTPDVPGKAVVEVYAKAPSGANGNDRPLKQLKGYVKTDDITGTKTVNVTINAGDLWFWNDQTDSKEFPTGAWTIEVGPDSADADLQDVTLNVTGARKAGVEVASAQPTGTELNLATPDNKIDAQLSVTKHDQSFWDLNDPALTVTYTSSDPSVASVDANGTVTALSTGAVLITATASADGETTSTDFPVSVINGDPDATGTAFANAHTTLVDFGDTTVPLATATGAGEQLSASTVPASTAAMKYTYQIAPMDTNTAGATVTPSGLFKAQKAGWARVTVTADDGTNQNSQSAIVRVAPAVQAGALNSTMTVAQLLASQTSRYTAASLKALNDAITHAQGVLANPEATQDQIDAEQAAISAAITGLDSVPAPTETETVPGPTQTETVPGPTETVKVPGPTETQTVKVPGPTTTVTATAGANANTLQAMTSARPTIKGTAKVKHTLKVVVGASKWTPDVAFSYRWFNGHKAIKGAAHKTYKAKRSDKGDRVLVKVTGQRSGYITTVRASKSVKIK